MVEWDLGLRSKATKNGRIATVGHLCTKGNSLLFSGVPTTQKNRSKPFNFAVRAGQTCRRFSKRKRLTTIVISLRVKSGDYLSSRRLTASTFGVKELNFCVRNGNRWILFAIITAMVIYLRLLRVPASPAPTYTNFFGFYSLGLPLILQNLNLLF